MPKDAYFFSHDANARNDPKILAMRSIYHMEGYGWYWAIVEIMREQENYKIPISKYTFDTLAMQLQCDRIVIEQYINDCCSEFKENGCSLLCKDDKFIWSESLLRRMAKVDKIRIVNKKNAISRWEKEERESLIKEKEEQGTKTEDNKEKEIKSNHSALRPLSNGNATASLNTENTVRDDDGIDLMDYFTDMVCSLRNGDREKLISLFEQHGDLIIKKAIDITHDNQGHTFDYFTKALNTTLQRYTVRFGKLVKREK